MKDTEVIKIYLFWSNVVYDDEIRIAVEEVKRLLNKQCDKQIDYIGWHHAISVTKNHKAIINCDLVVYIHPKGNFKTGRIGKGVHDLLDIAKQNGVPALCYYPENNKNYLYKVVSHFINWKEKNWTNDYADLTIFDLVMNPFSLIDQSKLKQKTFNLLNAIINFKPIKQ